MVTEYSRNAVFDAIVKAVISEYPNAYCATRLERVPQSFPAVYVLDRRERVANAASLDGTDNQERSALTIQIFTDDTEGAEGVAYSVLSLVHDRLKELMYIFDYNSPEQNTDPAIFRLIAEYHRVIGDLDVFETE